MKTQFVALRTPVIAMSVALAITAVLLLLAGADVFAAFGVLLGGALTTPSRISDMLMLLAPLLLCAVGLTTSFAAGQYNLGIEGQMTVGGVAAMWFLRGYHDGSPVILYWVGAVLCGMLMGAAWALLVALLKRYMHVSEIFAGLGFNFVALGLALYLVFGPWKRPGVASMSGTEPLADALWLPALTGTRLTLVSPILAIVMLVIVWRLIRHTHWGLQVRACGLSALASVRLGVPATRRTLEAMALCGACAGMAGALQVIGVYHALVPNVASGIGLMGLLVALLVRADVRWVALVALFFAIITSGSIQLPLALSIDSSISGVLQGLIVLAIIVARARRGEEAA
jgi:simple sugar transport system permease protein